MKETEVKKRGWVKNVAIIFLAVMLVLTFFSQTIMNRALPEVAAQHTQPGTITARVRGSGTVEANETFEVVLTGTRTVSEVRVRVGDEVSTGDLLFTLAGTGTEELDRAEQELHELEVKLEEELIKSPQTGNAVADAARNVQRARNALSDAQRVLAGIHYNEAALNSAQAANNEAQGARRAAEATESARAYDLAIARAELTALGPSPDEGGEVDPDVFARAQQKVRDAEFAFSTAEAAAAVARSTAGATADEFARHDESRARWNDANAGVRNAQLDLDGATSALSIAQESENTEASINAIGIRELRRQIGEKQDEVERLRAEGTGTEITSAVNGVVARINVSPGNMTESDTPLMEIEVVDRGYSLSFSAPAEQAARLTVGDNAEVDRGFFWFGDEVRAVLTGIRNDPQDPVMRRILMFDIIGNIDSGTQLNLSIGQRSENYNTVVPNSAMRSDTNGDFVLVIDSRSTPLGTRFVAMRADVNIIASDDTQTAVSGGLTQWDFVITTATEPVEPGMQVRLANN